MPISFVMSIAHIKRNIKYIPIKLLLTLLVLKIFYQVCENNFNP